MGNRKSSKSISSSRRNRSRFQSTRKKMMQETKPFVLEFDEPRSVDSIAELLEVWKNLRSNERIVISYGIVREKVVSTLPTCYRGQSQEPLSDYEWWSRFQKPYQEPSPCDAISERVRAIERLSGRLRYSNIRTGNSWIVPR